MIPQLLIRRDYMNDLFLFFSAIVIKRFHDSLLERLTEVTVLLMNQATNMWHASHICKLQKRNNIQRKTMIDLLFKDTYVVV